MRRLIVFLLTAAVGCAGARADETAPEEPKLPFFLNGVELNQPAQEAFRAWPSAAVLDRLYALPWRATTFQRASLMQQPVAFLLWVPWNRLSQRFLTETLAAPASLEALNARYLTVVANADRRPDLRERYQTGTWPVFSLLLPNGKPMLSQANPTGKALPITLGYVKPDVLQFTLQEGRVYFDRWAQVLTGVAQVYEDRLGDQPPPAAVLRSESSDQMARWLLGNVDAKNGGFGPAPKTVVPGAAEYAALREARQLPALVAPVRDMLVKLAASPMWDAKDGGVRRMAVLPDWGEVQEEKILDGNADLLRDLLFALRGKDDPDLRRAAVAAARFLTTRLARPGGGFYNAQLAPAGPGDRDNPRIDRLVIAGGNAMAGAALLRAGASLGDPALSKSGRDAVDLVLSRAVRAGRGADHVIEPSPEPYRFLTSQADVAFGLLDAYESTGDARYRRAAKDVVDFAVNNLFSPGEVVARHHLAIEPDAGLLSSPKWPMPDNVRLARAMLRLAALGEGDAYRTRAEGIIAAFANDCTAFRVRGIDPALAVEEATGIPVVVTISGPAGDARTQALRLEALKLAYPWTIVATAEDGSASPSAAVAAAGVSRPVSDPKGLAGAVDAVVSAARDKRP